MSLNEPISKEEIWKTIVSCGNDKAPETDGLSKEFYTVFWNEIHELLLDSYNHSLKSGKMSLNQRQGIITLIPKSGKDNRYLKNWRPLTLANQDYKFFSKSMAGRPTA